MATRDAMRMYFLNAPVVRNVIDGNFRKCVDIVRDAYVAHDRDLTANPHSVFLRFADRPNARIIALPAYVGGSVGCSGVKWIASYPDNVHISLPRASAVIVLNDCRTGFPFACLEASTISAARTAASAVLAAETIWGTKQVRSIGFIGSGFISAYIYRFFIDTGWDVGSVYLHDQDRGKAERFAEHTCCTGQHRIIEVAQSAEETIRMSEMTICATTAARPYIKDMGAFAHCPVILHISLRDIVPDIILQSENIVDDMDHVLRADTSVHLAEKQCGGRDFISGTLADLIARRVVLQRNRPVVFSPFGLGVLDIALAKWVYDEAHERGTLQEAAGFFDGCEV